MLELKIVQRGRRINLSPHQYAFHLKHAALGCPSYILVQYHPKGTTKPAEIELRLYSGSQAAEILEKGIETAPIVSYPLSAVDWPDLANRLAQ